MNAAVAIVLGCGVLAAWIGTLGFLRLRTPLDRLHAVTLINVTTGGAILVAAFLSEGATSRTLKCALIYVVMLASGALISHVTGRALHLREGERR